MSTLGHIDKVDFNHLCIVNNAVQNQKTKTFKGCTKSKTLRLRYLQYRSNQLTAQSEHFISTSPLDHCPNVFPNSVVII